LTKKQKNETSNKGKRIKNNYFCFHNNSIHLKMRNLLLLFLLIIGGSAYSQLFWQVSGKSTKTKSYILGTHSLLPAKALDSIPGVYRAFNKCNVVISTYDSYSVDAEAQLKKAALLPFHKSMKDYLSDSAYIKVDKELKKSLKIGLKELALMHPAMIRQMYLAELFAQASNIADEAQTDSYFQRVAAVKGIKVIGIENYSLYIASLFDGGKIQFYADKLTDDISKAELYKANFKKLLHYYQSNDLNKTIEVLNAIEIQQDNNTKKFLSDNQLVKLTDLLNTNVCFYTLDVRLLAGENGLIEQLRKAGYEVKPYKK
jgi:uncharacterized protein YbaP (TraB family)